MSKSIRAASVAALLALAATPAAQAASIPPPPTNPVYVHGGTSGCTPDYPCDPTPYDVGVDKTYPGRVVTWAKNLLP